MAPLTGPTTKGLQVFAIPAVVLLVSFLGYTSQWLFTSPDLQPGPPSRSETITFNILLLNLWWNYYKACTVSPGTYRQPPATNTTTTTSCNDQKSQPKHHEQQQQKWCRKCDAPKPPRAHHCRHCRRCIPKMDHHCPWTGNCVSMQTFPYFLRFLVATNLALAYLGRLLYVRFRALFDERHLPAYLGPSTFRLVHLTLLGLGCAGVTILLFIMLVTTGKGWLLNRTMIEEWEIERHEALLARHGIGAGRGGSTWWATEEEKSDDDDDDASGSHADTAPGLRRVEFPYDIGIWNNMAQAMGTRNFLAWFWPFAGGPVVDERTGRVWEENGFNARTGMWPPPDPDKQRRGWPGVRSAEVGVQLPTYATPEEEIAAFRARQERDERLRRRRRELAAADDDGRSGVIAELEEDEDLEDLFPPPRVRETGLDGEPGWTNAEGDRLRDFGVDEDADEDFQEGGGVEEDEDDDVPLGELLRRRRAARGDVDT